MTASALWTPGQDRISQTKMMAFLDAVNRRHGLELRDYADLHRWSISDRGAFWSMIWDWCGVIGVKGDVLLEHDVMPGARFFPQATLNYAENLLSGGHTGDALIFWGEDKVKRRVSWSELSLMVSKAQQAMQAAGIVRGDRIAAMMPNMPETIAMMLAAASIGAIWCSCSPDFGERGVLDRFGQIEPKLFLTCDGYWYNGKRIDTLAKLQEIVPHLPSVQQVIVVPYLGQAREVAAALPRAVTFEDFLQPYHFRPLVFEPLPFSHPLFILFSSGTTGVPKCIVHGAGGVLLQHLKEHQLHCDVRATDRVLYYTTCGWMMWNWLVSGLGSGATLCLYDGSPFAPDGRILFDYAQEEEVMLFGTSAKYLDACAKAGLMPARTHRLDALRLMASTGSPLSADSYEYVYSSIKKDLHLASISGGTDIVSCFVLGDPTRPVYRGEIQAAGLGMAVDVWNEQGQGVRGDKGELVCTRAFPCMPVMFWNDPDGAKYRAAYFERFPGVWCHGDFAEITAHDGFIIHGRSDATLNPGGVRIGTAELYAQVEQIPEVLEALAIGQEWDNDVRVILFVRLREGCVLDEALVNRLKTQIRSGASPRHVPAKIIAVADLPRTRSGKITELAVREVVHGRPVKNTEALANPDALDLFRALPQLQD